MNQLTKHDVLRIAEENDVKFIRLQFADILGIVKNVAITVEQLEKALDGEIMFDGSSIEGFVRIEESDMYLKPDFNTFVVLPWGPKEGAVARIICDVYNPDQTPFAGCPRNVLKRVIAEATELGYSMNVGPEAEFFLFQRDEKGRPTTVSNDEGGYFDLAPVDFGENARRDMVLILEKLGFEIEASHHEVAEGQHEIGFKYADALRAADNIVTFKTVVKTVAQQHGLHATFMPKPVFGIAGSGMHCNLSLFKDNKNAFFNSDSKYQLSETAIHFIGGIMKHARGMASITNPIVNSYKRLVTGYEAPVYIAWALRNRSPLIRIPARRGIGTRVEVRNPDPSCNPYLTFAVLLKAGLDGIKNKIAPPAPVEENIYDMTLEERKKLQVGDLPASLGESIAELKKSETVKEALGEHVFSKYVTAKQEEWESYRMRVHDWEVEKYLTKY